MSDLFDTPGTDPEDSVPEETGSEDTRTKDTRTQDTRTEDTDRPDTGSEARELVRSGWHRVNIGHLVMGLAFLCFVGGWGLVQADVVTGDAIRWLLPIPWLVAGAVGLVVVAVTSARRHGVRR
ncbi:hypothetical protein SAMN04487968_11080 [Nocardioides terrae]|uniref:Uncharacterized protein n=1 Tax=Nocardioides terrae TaxID=574651 RepID=A0A1I1LIM7_9ACTN|nr:hypothetical protein [Nocardioides terrae]SFC72964.1 hypothetical protein SAMN04487968_11080 [Nocardioides terrae]